MGDASLTPELLSRLRGWFRIEARSFPWTETDHPYAIWISEIMLQQTVVTAALEPYRRWMARWPDVASLARADEAEVLRAWEGLGYASRARNLHRAALALTEQGRKTLPDTYDELRALPGVGDYTASALLSFAFHQPALTLDANLKRVFQRLGAAPDWSPALEARWRELWLSLIDGSTSREANQAVMQHGQLVCTARSPRCAHCLLAPGCLAFRNGLQGEIPRPLVRKVTDVATTVVVCLDHARRIWLARPLQGRFSTLWLLPPWPTPLPTDARMLTPRVHTYTRYRDRLTPFALEVNGSEGPPSDGPPSEGPPSDGPLPEGWVGRWATAEEAQGLGMVSTYRKIVDEVLS